jgi:hypothetical protein
MVKQGAHAGRGRGRDRSVEMLASLQLGLCGRCGRARYATRRQARHAARIAAPGVRLRAYQCGDDWHLTSPPGRPQHIVPPVTVCQIRAAAGLDLRARGERVYGGCRSRQAAPTVPTAGGRRRWVCEPSRDGR